MPDLSELAPLAITEKHDPMSDGTDPLLENMTFFFFPFPFFDHEKS